MRLLLYLLLFAGIGFAQCGTAPHCVVLSWTPGAGGATPTSFNVLRSTTTGGPYSQVGTTPASLTSYTDMSQTGNVLTEGATYFYVIAAASLGGASPNSTEVSAKIPFLLPTAPTSPLATAH